MEKNKIIKVKLLTFAILLLIIGIFVVIGIFMISNNAKPDTLTDKNIKDTQAINEISKEQNKKNPEKSESIEKIIPEEREITALIKEPNSNLNGYDTVKFGVCSYDQSSIDEKIKNSPICSIDIKSDEDFMGHSLSNEGKKQDIPWFQDEKKEQPTKVKDISNKYIISEAYIGGNWNIRVCANLFNSTEAKNAGLSDKEMNEMNFIDAKRLSYNKKKENNKDIVYEIVDVSSDTLLVRQTDVKNSNKVTIEVYKDLGNGCHIRLYNNNLYNSSLKAYSKYKNCSKDELLLLGKKFSESISIIRTEKIELSEKWQKLLSK